MSYFDFRQGMSERIAKQLMSCGHQRERTASGWEAENSRSYVIEIQRSMNLKEPLNGGASRHDQTMNGVNRGA